MKIKQDVVTIEYMERVNKHIFLFRMAALELNRRILDADDCKLPLVSISQWTRYDLTKTSKAELRGYADYFPECKDENKPAFDLAWVHHYENNEHHPEHFGKHNAMPAKFVVEMWADWLAASYQYQQTWNMENWLNEQLGDGGEKAAIIHPTTFVVIAKVAHLCGYSVSAYDHANSSSKLFVANDDVLDLGKVFNN